MAKTAVQIGRIEKPRYRKCEICGKEIKSQGYGGHLFLEHGKKVGVVASVDDLQKRLNELEKKRGRAASSQSDVVSDDSLSGRVSELEDRLQEHDEKFEDREHDDKERAEKLKDFEKRLDWLDDFMSTLKIEKRSADLLGLREATEAYLIIPIKDWEELIEQDEGEELKAKEEEEEEEEERK